MANPANESADDGGTDRGAGEQINFLAPEEMIQKWKAHAEAEGFGSYSSFYRWAINQAVTGDHSGGGGSLPTEFADRLSEVEATVNRLDGRMDDIDDDLRVIKDAVKERPSVKQLANDVFALLPTKDELISYATQETSPRPQDRGEVALDGTIETIAQLLDTPENQVQEAVQKLQADTHQVHATTMDAEIEGWSDRHLGSGDVTRVYKEG